MGLYYELASRQHNKNVSLHVYKGSLISQSVKYSTHIFMTPLAMVNIKQHSYEVFL